MSAILDGNTGLTVNLPAAGNPWIVQLSGVQYGKFNLAPPNVFVILDSFDNGANYAPFLAIGRNSNAGTPSAAFIQFRDLNNTTRDMWFDASGNARVNTTAPTNATDTGGTVIGTQTSMAEAKLISDDLSVLGEVMGRIRAGALAVRRFSYRSGSYNHQLFEGVVTDYAPAYGMDRDIDHPAGKSLNEVQIIGDLLRTVDWLVRRVTELEAKLT